MALLSQYLRYKGYIFTEHSLPYEEWFFVEKSKSQKMALAGFSLRGTHSSNCEKTSESQNIFHNYIKRSQLQELWCCNYYKWKMKM